MELVGGKVMQVVEMKTKLEEKIEALEKEKGLLLEEVRQLKEVVELSEKAKDLEDEVVKLRKEVETLKDRLPQEFLHELGKLASSTLAEDGEEEKVEEECSSYEEEELL